MTKNATIKVTSRKNDDEDKIEYITSGMFGFKNHSWYILYEESEEMGMLNSKVTVKINSDDVTVVRTGDFKSKMTYKKGVSTEFIYHLPYGTLPIVIDTKSIEYSFDDNGGSLKMIYHLSVNEENEENIMEITVKKDEA